MLKLIVLIFFSSCTSLFYHPDSIQYVKPEKLNLTYEEVIFHSKDGTELVGWFFPATTPETKGTIVHFHGNAQNMSSHFLSLSWIMDKGYNLFVWDYRGFGISDGTPSPKGIYEDSLAALDEGRRLWAQSGKGQFIVYGQSLGGAIAMRALQDYKDLSAVDLVVQDSTFMSYQDMGFHKLLHSILFPLSPVAYLLVSDKYSSQKFVRRIDIPTLVIVGENDKVVDPKFGREIYKTLTTSKKWLWEIPNGSHIDVFNNPQDPYREDFIRLLHSLEQNQSKESVNL